MARRWRRGRKANKAEQGEQARRQPKARSGAGYSTDWSRRYPARMARVLLLEGLVRPVMTMLASPTVLGEQRLDGMTGPLLFAANHHSHLDTPLLVSRIPEPWRHRLVVGAAADYFFANAFSSPLSALVVGAIPIERHKVARRSAALVTRLLVEGWSVLIYPEGGRSDALGQPFRGGAGYLAMRAGVPVVPVHIEGTDRVLAKGRRIPRRRPTTISFGVPLVPAEGEDARRFSVRIEQAVRDLAGDIGSPWGTSSVTTTGDPTSSSRDS
jgi:1-acyl-sn-glycerol-3-phosphate acyltransferase